MKEEDDLLWTLLDNVNLWIRFADAKAGAVLTVSAGAAALSASAALSDREDMLGLALIAVSLAASVGALVCGLLTLAPFTQPDEDLDTTVYFGHIAKFESSSDYLAAVRATRADDSLSQEVAHQVRTNALIADYKFEKVATASQFVAAQLMLAVVVMGLDVVKAF